jgi:phosphoribosylanthranilate isomerase
LEKQVEVRAAPLFANTALLRNSCRPEPRCIGAKDLSVHFKRVSPISRHVSADRFAMKNQPATRVKICGITRLEDACLAIELGASALGFNFYEKSPRCLAPADAWKILRKLPALIATVGVFVNWNSASIIALAESLRLSAVQLHGDESAAVTAECARHFPVIKAFRTESKFQFAQFREHRSAASFLLDAATSAAKSRDYGGTGCLADWKLAKRAAEEVPILLAGGLTPENVAEAILTVRPYAVDVSSGVESRPGKKDPAKLRSFFAQVGRANSQPSLPSLS